MLKLNILLEEPKGNRAVSVWGKVKIESDHPNYLLAYFWTEKLSCYSLFPIDLSNTGITNTVIADTRGWTNLSCCVWSCGRFSTSLVSTHQMPRAHIYPKMWQLKVSPDTAKCLSGQNHHCQRTIVLTESKMTFLRDDFPENQGINYLVCFIINWMGKTRLIWGELFLEQNGEKGENHEKS